ncbi:MAG: D-alanyl-D-alanine carboxypeptidase/D-alanyl-D-alanine-endopeptidase [Bacteroidota bacterium]
MRYVAPLLLSLSTFFAAPIFAQSNLQRAIDQFVRAEAFEHASIGIAVVDVESGQLLASYDPQRSLIPASTLKVVTTATALALLTPEFQFKTKLEYDGEISSTGILNGHLYLTGQADPTLGSDQMEGTMPLQDLLERFRLIIQQQGIGQINGHIVGDGTYLNSAATPPSWQWADLGNYYAAGCWGLNLHENYYYLRFQQTRKLGATPPISLVEPTVPNLVFINELTNARRGRGGDAYIYGSPYTYERYVRGTIGVGAGTISIKGAIPDPPYFAAFQLEQSLASIGINATNGSITELVRQRRGESTQKRTSIYTHNSPTLARIVERTNTKSVNLYCESMVRTLGKEIAKSAALEAGLQEIIDYWRQQDVFIKGVNLFDGSGLSARNSVTAQFMTEVLRLTAKNPSVATAFETSLPLAGKSGILKNKFKGTIAENNLRAKSGTLERVRTYAGYTRNRKGQLLAFCILVNNYQGSGTVARKRMEQLMLQFCE